MKRNVLLAALAVVLASLPVAAQDASQRYPKMAPIGEYLMDRTAEIALARSAAPESISRDASVLVLSRRGYEIALEGTNGWVCWVGRAWLSMFDHPEFWNPKIRAADCTNPPGVRSTLPLVYKRTELLLAGGSKEHVIASIKSAIEKKELPALEPGTMSYMMSKASYLTDDGDHNLPHVMFFQSMKDGSAWGANLANSPVLGVNYWYISEGSYPQLKSLPPLSVFLVAVDKWSDGSSARAGDHHGK